jgi:hypothetical protein
MDPRDVGLVWRDWLVKALCHVVKTTHMFPDDVDHYLHHAYDTIREDTEEDIRGWDEIDITSLP